MCLFIVEIHMQVIRDKSGLLFPVEEDTAHLALLDILWILLRTLNTQLQR